MDVYNEKMELINIGEQIFNQLVYQHLETAHAKLEANEDLTEQEEMAVALASGARIKECKLDGNTLTITTEPVGIETTAIGFRIFQQRNEIGEAE